MFRKGFSHRDTILYIFLHTIICLHETWENFKESIKQVLRYGDNTFSRIAKHDVSLYRL